MIPQQLLWASADGTSDSRGGTLTYGPIDAMPSLTPAPRVTVKGPDGTIYVTNQAAAFAPTLTTITLSGAHAVGSGTTTALPITLAGGATPTAGIRPRQQLLIGSTGTVAGANTRGPVETVRVKQVVSATQILVWGPLLHARVSGESIMGAVLEATIAGTAMTDRFRRGKAVWEWASDGSAVRGRVAEGAVDVVRHRILRLAGIDDLRLIDPEGFRGLAARRDPDEVLELGWQELTRRLLVRNVWGLIPSEPLRVPTVYFAWYFEHLSLGTESDVRQAEVMRMTAERILEQAVESNPVDPDEDDVVTGREQPSLSAIRVHRMS